MQIYEGDDPEPTAVARARRAFVAWLDDQRIPVDEASDAVLVLSELVTNAVRHARTAFAVDVDLDGGRVRIAVFDRDARPPSVQGAPPGATGGRGLQIVAAVAEQWGTDVEDRGGIGGKTVWALVPLGG